MLMQDVLKYPARVMTPAQREQFFEEGCGVVEGIADARWLKRLRDAMNEMVDASRQVATDDGRFVLEEGHSPETPRLRRLSSPVTHHPTFWEFASQSPSADLAVDLCGPDVKFFHSKLNFKWPKGGHKFDWHQDIPAWPHTDYSPVTVGILMEDCDEAQGPLLAIRGSHKPPMHSMYDKEGNWTLKIPEEEMPAGWRDNIISLTGPAGSAVLINCRVIHGSSANRSDKMRPLLLNVYSSADSMPYTANPIPSPYQGEIVRGKPARFSCHDPRGCELPPDWAKKGYSGPWNHQTEGLKAAAAGGY